MALLTHNSIDKNMIPYYVNYKSQSNRAYNELNQLRAEPEKFIVHMSSCEQMLRKQRHFLSVDVAVSLVYEHWGDKKNDSFSHVCLFL